MPWYNWPKYCPQPSKIYELHPDNSDLWWYTDEQESKPMTEAERELLLFLAKSERDYMDNLRQGVANRINNPINTQSPVEYMRDEKRLKYFTEYCNKIDSMIQRVRDESKE